MPVTPVNIAPAANASSTAIEWRGKMGRGETVNIWVKGDSIVLGSPGTTTQATDNWPRILGILIQAAYKQSVSTSNINVVNLGVGGSDIVEDDQIANFNASMTTLGYAPDLLLWAYGTNDLNKGVNNLTPSGNQAVDYFYNRTMAAGQRAAEVGSDFAVIEALSFPNTGQESVTVNDRYENKWIWAFNEGGRLAAQDLGKPFIRLWDAFMAFMAVANNPLWKMETLYRVETNMVHPSTIGAAAQAGAVAMALLPDNLVVKLEPGKDRWLLFNEAKAKYPLDEGTRNTFAGYDTAFYPTVANVTGSDDNTVAGRELVDWLVYNPTIASALFIQTIDNSGAGAGVTPPTILVESYTNTPAAVVYDGPVPGSGVATGAGEQRQFVCNLPHGLSRIRLRMSQTTGLDFKGGNFLIEVGATAGRGSFVQAAGLVESATATTAVIPASSITGTPAIGQHFRVVAGTTVQQAAITGWDAGTRTVTVASWPGGTPTTASQFVISQVLYTGGTPAGNTIEEFFWYSNGRECKVKYDFLYATATGSVVTQYDIPLPVGTPVPFSFSHQSANGSVLVRSATARPGSTVSNTSVSTQLNHCLRRDSAYASGFMVRSTTAAAIVGHLSVSFDYDIRIGS